VTAPATVPVPVTDAALGRLVNAADAAYETWQGARVWKRIPHIGERFIMTERRQKRELLRI